jgi:hypothetical protein
VVAKYIQHYFMTHYILHLSNLTHLNILVGRGQIPRGTPAGLQRATF